jgi:O-antigen/teichoic acid export membrane protein
MKLNKSLIGGSLILLISINFFNFFNFVFQLSMARMLTIAQYGILASLFSIIYIFGFFMESIQTIVAKYTAKEKEKEKLKNILKRTSKKAWGTSLIFFTLYLLIAIPLTFLLKISYPLLALTGLSVFIVFFLPITRGIMQGEKKFKSLGGNMVIEATMKLVLGIFFVYVGWQVFGAILGVILGAVIAFLLSFTSILDVMRSSEKKSNTKNIRGYSKQTFVIIFTIMVFFSLDVIMAKILFTDEIAGAYAIASVLAKIIFFGTLPISKAMFPLSAENKKEKGSSNVFANSIVILFLAIFASLTVFYFFPSLIIGIFSGKIIPESASILFLLGIAMSLISLANLNLLYKLSREKVSGYQYLPIFILVEIALLFFFSASLLQFSIAFITASVAFLWGSIILLGK